MPIRIAPICRVPHRDIPRICVTHDHHPASSSSSSPIPAWLLATGGITDAGELQCFDARESEGRERRRPPQYPLERLNSPDSGISCAQGSMAAELFGLAKQNVFFLALHRAADQDFLPAPRDWLICNPAEEKRRPFLKKVLLCREGSAAPVTHELLVLARRTVWEAELQR